MAGLECERRSREQRLILTKTLRTTRVLYPLPSRSPTVLPACFFHIYFCLRPDYTSQLLFTLPVGVCLHPGLIYIPCLISLRPDYTSQLLFTLPVGVCLHPGQITPLSSSSLYLWVSACILGLLMLEALQCLGYTSKPPIPLVLQQAFLSLIYLSPSGIFGCFI
ncbi:hypothetical protein JB92DRAFT_2831785 [Gautieria morchelliformis]|nr:hypothetical protein JB92DRAFT_2831785 [Gautieria morchelliformis]